MAEIENFVIAEKGEGQKFRLEFSDPVLGFIRLIAEENGLTEVQVVEKLVAAGIDIAYREREGKHLLFIEPGNGPGKLLKLFRKSSS